jgi:hypothetical protein
MCVRDRVEDMNGIETYVTLACMYVKLAIIGYLDSKHTEASGEEQYTRQMAWPPYCQPSACV